MHLPPSTPETLDPKTYTVVLIAPLEIEARAALYLLDERHDGKFALERGDEHVFHAGRMCGHNTVIATLPAGQEYGTASSSELASHIKRFFPNLWFGLLIGVAAGLPHPSRDIRLGDVLVGLPEGDSAGLIAYDLGKETKDGFRPLRGGYALAATAQIVRSAIGSIKVEAPNDTEKFMHYYRAIHDKEHSSGTFMDPGQDADILVEDSTGTIVRRDPRPEGRRTRVWYGPIGTGEKLLKNTEKRNALRDQYGLIGLEMEAAGLMNRIPVGVIRGVSDYGDHHKNKQWQPYAAAMTASYAKAILAEIRPAMPNKEATLEGKIVSGW